MKKIVLIAFLLVCGTNFAQDFNSIPLSQDSDYKKAEKTIIESCNYLLSTPIDSNELLRLQHIQLVMKWMEGTPDYTFSLTNTATKFSGDNSNLLGIYLAALVIHIVKDHGDAKDLKNVDLQTVTIALNYVTTPENHVPLTSSLKKLIKAKENGKLAEAID